MELHELPDFELVRWIYSDPELFGRIAEDGQTEQDIAKKDNTIYLGMMTEDGVVGVWEIEGFNSTTVIFHCNLLEEFRAKYAPYAGSAVLDWFVNETDEGVKKAIAFVPDNYPDVCHYCLKHGMAHQGTITKAISKHEQLRDLNIYGITKDEAARFLGVYPWVAS